MASIRTAGLTKYFGDLRAVNEIDLDLPEGGVAGFVGPNGAGKSTTIRMLLGLIQSTSGDGEVLGHPIADPPGYLHRVGALIEAPAFYPTLTGQENLRVFAALGGHDRGRIAELLEVVGLRERGNDRYKNYSLGMKQRLGIALALLPDRPALCVRRDPGSHRLPGTRPRQGQGGRGGGVGNSHRPLIARPGFPEGEAGMGVGGNHVIRSKRRASCPRHRLHHPGRNPLGRNLLVAGRCRPCLRGLAQAQQRREASDVRRRPRPRDHRSGQ
jgi:ABC-type transport system involved in cytochrome c biogenesis ATPase subunit